MARPLIQPASSGDAGQVSFVADLASGSVRVSVRAPLAVNESVADVPIIDMMEFLSKLLLNTCAAQRMALASRMNAPPPSKTEPS
jgi:hypothetical protein